MKRYIAKRLVISLGVLVLVSMVVFGLMHLQPGNPYSHLMAPETSPETYERLLTQLGYYDPLPIKYGKWLWNFIRGNMGYSIVTGQPIRAMISDRMGNTLVLTLSALALSTLVGTLLGISTALRRHGAYDQLVSFLSILVLSIPTFFIGLVLIKIFAFDLNWLPTSGVTDVRAHHTGFRRVLDVLHHLILPASTLALTQVTFFQKYVRAAMLDVMDSQYIKAARAKGMTLREAVFRHGLKNALIPFMTLLFLQLPGLFSGALITETLFIWPGIGRLSYDSIQRRDHLVIIAILMISAIIIQVSNFIVDILYGLIDKRIQWS